MADALAVFGIYSYAFKLFAKVLKARGGLGSEWRLQSSKMIIERARLETTMQQLARANLDTFSGLKSVVVGLLSDMTNSLENAATLANAIESRTGSMAVLQFAFREDAWRQTMDRIIEMNAQLEKVATIVAKQKRDEPETNDSAGMSESANLPEPVMNEILNTLHNRTGEPPEKLEQHLKLMDVPVSPKISPSAEEEPSGSLIERVGTCCGMLLKACGKKYSNFVEILDCFQLWVRAVESEGLYDAIDQASQDPTNIDRQSLGRLLLPTEVQIGEILVWWQQEISDKSTDGELHILLSQCADAMMEAKQDFPWLQTSEPGDIKVPRSDIDGLTGAALEIVQLLVNNLATCLPSIVDFCRKRQRSEISAADVAEMLQLSVELIEPASEALSQAAANARADSTSTDESKVDFDHIRSVFDKQSAELTKWREKHGQDIVAKLAQKNDAKLAAVADTVGNIADFLGK
ncbi:hypothetical protein QQX98_009147 [Neonectria punicea]|uniref:Uncharacterized protein n=1 Tax=Neonectria punicea TaxID=979145 RepID=A0ABR1GT80_9HYPO